MAAGLQCGGTGLSDSASEPAGSVVSANVRVKATLGAIATLADVITFSGATVAGNWVMPSLRCLVGSVPAINASSQGIGYSATGSPSGPMQMQTTDSRASGS